jgi:hypothetical protein
VKKDTNDTPASIDHAKRLFLKKLAVISAYSAPAATLASLGINPSTARAQVVAEPPLVVSAAFMAGGDGPDEPFGTLKITFSKPMATSLNTCKSVTGSACDEVMIDSKIDPLPSVQSVAGNAPMVDSKLDELDLIDLSDGWTWSDGQTEEKQIFSPIKSVRLQLNTPDLACVEADQYQSDDGDLLVPFETTLNTWEHCEGCLEQVIISKIDHQP